MSGAFSIAHRCDILASAAMERVVTAENAGRLKCRILAEGVNGPVTPEADAMVVQRRVEVFGIPNTLCNSGGVIVCFFEWAQDLDCLFWTEEEDSRRLEQLLDSAFSQVRRRALAGNVFNRTAALAIDVERVCAGEKPRGPSP